MFVIDSLKHNRFKKVDIPRNSEYVKAVGLTRPGVSFSGDTAISTSESKVEVANKVNKEVFNDSE